jgi:hypothetical protein
MTNADLEARLKALSPIQKVTLCQNVVARLSVDGDAVREAERHISTEIRRSEGYAWLIQQASNDPSAMLDEGKSAEIAEVFLLAAADDPQMSLSQFRAKVVEKVGSCQKRLRIADSQRLDPVLCHRAVPRSVPHGGDETATTGPGSTGAARSTG